ncbi:MAG: hypothetical protein AAFQ66_08295 [Pseudomonadota bacterium]
MATASLSACTGAVGGSGETSRGEVVAGELIVRSTTDQAVSITGARGWRCDGQLSPEQAKQLGGTINVPVDCTDGRRGMLRVTSQPTKNPVAVGSFRLSDGTTGTIAYTYLVE